MQKKYLKVEEVDASEIDFNYKWAPDPQKIAFAEDVRLRLEQTNKSKAVRYLFKDRKTTESYRNYAMKKLREALGSHKVASRILPAEDGQHWVCFKNV